MQAGTDLGLEDGVGLGDLAGPVGFVAILQLIFPLVS